MTSPFLGGMLECFLLPEGFRVSQAGDGRSAMKVLLRGDIDLLVLDLTLPDLPGEEVCRQIRKEPAVQGIPILITTGRLEEGVAARCFDSGADGYFVKPFDREDFLAYARALLRLPKTYLFGDAVIQNGRLLIQPFERRMAWNGRSVDDFTPKEFELLKQLVVHAPHVIDKNTLALRIWGVPHRQLHQRTLDVHIQRVRKKLGSPADACLKTVPAVGYPWWDQS